MAMNRWIEEGVASPKWWAGLCKLEQSVVAMPKVAAPIVASQVEVGSAGRVDG